MENEQSQVPGTPSQDSGAAAQKKKTLVIAGGAVLIAIVGLLLSNAFSGEKMAERIVEEAYERASDGAIDVDYNADGDGSVRVTGEDGMEVEYSAGGNVDLPDAWPSDVPVMDGASLTYAGSVNPGSGQGGVMIVFMTDKKPTEVTEYYTQTLTGAGWTIVSTVNMGEASMLGVSKGEQEGSVYATGDGADGTSVTISITQ